MKKTTYPVSLALLALAISTAAVAAEGDEKKAESEDSTNLEEILVTGSLIPREANEGISPITVISDQDMKEGFIVSADPAEHVERIRAIEQLGATIVVLQNNSGADPHGAIRVYGEQVLPQLRGARVG